MAAEVGNASDVYATLGDAWRHPVTRGFRYIFYIASPAETSFEQREDVPDYVNAAVPFFMFFILFEQVLLHLHDRANLRLNDAFSSVSAGLVSLLPLVFVKSIEVSAYIYVHEHWRLVELPWDSPWTWLLAFLGVDLGYYWAHRMAHEINFMWAAHQVHHSSEDYNLSTALRQSVLQRYNTWLFYVPLALFAPVSAFMVHIQFNLLYQFWIHTELCYLPLAPLAPISAFLVHFQFNTLYQFWIHTEVIGSLGPLEHVLNTPSHHRVHHGRNRYCIDKNYGGTLIVWDRIFGTFAWEDEKVAYGLVHPLASWDVVYIQFCWWKHMFTTAAQRRGVHDKLMTFLKGPGWEPGKPRLGLEEDIPIIDPALEKKNRYNKSVSLWCHVYIHAHFALAVLAHQVVLQYKHEMSQGSVTLAILFVLWTLTNLSYVYENKWYAGALECVRCAVYLLADTYLCGGGAGRVGAGACPAPMLLPRALYLASAVLWAVQCARALPSPPSVKDAKMD